jgi:hypothetical protein
MQHEQASFDASFGIWDLPLTNLLDSRPQIFAKAASSKDVNSTKFKIDLGYIRKVGIIWFTGLKTTSLGFISIKAGVDSSFVSNNYEIETTTWPQDSVAGEYNSWEEWTLNGVYLGDEYAKLNWPRVFIPSAKIDCRYVEVKIRDTTATLPLEIGCFGVSEVWEPELGFDFSYDWEITNFDESDIQTVPMGSTYVDLRKNRRRLNLGFDVILESEVWARTFGMSLIKGKSQPLVIVPFSDSGTITRFEKAAVYGFGG